MNKRLYSLDALRGFDMFWIIGAEEIFHTMSEATHHPFWNALSNQFTHPVWDGFHAYDLIFPLFMFISGISSVYSIDTSLSNGISKNTLLWKVIKRGMILFILGMIYNNGFAIRPLSDFRIMSVLGRIGIAYTFSCIIYIYADKRFQTIWFAGLLIGYWIILKYTSAPGFPIGDLTEPGNFASYFDRTVLAGKLSRGIHDTVGLFNNIAAVATSLAGVLTGNYLKNSRSNDVDKTKWIAVGGLTSLGLAMIWNLDFPINKNMWSSSFVLYTTGWNLLLFALFYFIIDVKGIQRWASFFKVIGMNSILIYMSGKFIQWGYTNKALFQWLGELIGDPYNAVALAITAFAIKRIFLKFL
ncbi:MAG: acyltransferase family protein [Bacteroidota bacterium]